MGVYSDNDKDLVEKIARFLNFELDKCVKVDGNKRVPFPSPITVRSVLTNFCDF